MVQFTSNWIYAETDNDRRRDAQRVLETLKAREQGKEKRLVRIDAKTTIEVDL